MKEIISPDTNIIQSWQLASDMSLPRAIKEIVDNSSDAGAPCTAINLSEDSTRITITDSGRGCVSTSAFFSPGKHERRAAHISGRFGIGLVQSSVWLAKILEVISSTGTEYLHAEANWDRVITEHDWEVNNFFLDQPPTGIRRHERGTTIILRDVDRARLRAWAKLPDILGRTFAPGLTQGRKILFDDESVVPAKLPHLKDKISSSGEWNERVWKLIAGRVGVDFKGKWGWTISYGHRVIVEGESRYGFGEFGSAGFFGYLALFDRAEKWKLKSFKDEIEEAEEFLESLYPQIEGLLHKAQSQTLDLELKSIKTALENKLEEAFGFKAKRTYIDNGEHGTKRETGTGTRHKDAEQKKPNASGVLSGAGLPARGNRGHLVCSNEDWLCKIGGSKRCMEATINLLHPQTPCLRKTPERLLEIIICHISAYSELELHCQFDLAFNW